MIEGIVFFSVVGPDLYEGFDMLFTCHLKYIIQRNFYNHQTRKGGGQC